MPVNNVRYDEDADALYLRVSDGAVHDSAEIEPGVVVDVDADGVLVGVEVLNASKSFDVERRHDLSQFNAMYGPFIEDTRGKMAVCAGR